MSKNRHAVIDLGSNTFHLLIVEKDNIDGFFTVHKERIFTGLSEGGVDTIAPESIQRGLAALHRFREVIGISDVNSLTVIGTASLRKANNRQVFISQGEEILGTRIRIIDGLAEAEYIFRGVMLLPGMDAGTKLIMDVGGGSTECILVCDGKKAWANSYPIGVGILHALFHKSDPISQREIEAMEMYIESHTADLSDAILWYKPELLVGASGSFEVLETMSGGAISTDVPRVILADTFYSLYSKITRATTAERTAMPGIPPDRVKLIVVGMVLKKYVFDLVSSPSILVSPFALKEGVISEMMQVR